MWNQSFCESHSSVIKEKNQSVMLKKLSILLLERVQKIFIREAIKVYTTKKVESIIEMPATDKNSHYLYLPGSEKVHGIYQLLQFLQFIFSF